MKPSVKLSIFLDKLPEENPGDWIEHMLLRFSKTELIELLTAEILKRPGRQQQMRDQYNAGFKEGSAPLNEAIALAALNSGVYR